MSSVSDHYSQLLAPVYTWMTGSVEAALEAGKSEIDELRLQLPAAPWSPTSARALACTPSRSHARACACSR